LSGLSAAANALIGVFLDDQMPGASEQPPPSLDERSATDFTTLSPLLRQVFFIGDGLTGTGSRQQFVVPPGAPRLFLGSNDVAGANNNNTGQFAVLVSTSCP